MGDADGSSQRSKRAFYDQHVVNVILAVYGLGNARFNHNAEFCIFRLSQKISPYHLRKHFIFPAANKIIPATQKYLTYAPKTKYSSPVASNVVTPVYYYAKMLNEEQLGMI